MRPKPAAAAVIAAPPKAQHGIRKLSAMKLADPVSRAHSIVRYAHESAHALLAAFETVRSSRGAKTGTTTDEEQDLLRAMLVMTGAGLDSALKQLIRDALPIIVNRDESARAELETFVTRRLRDDAGGISGGASKFLAKILTAKSHQKRVIEEYVLDLTGQSLQSVDELSRAAKALGVTPKSVSIEEKELRPIFMIRNKIIHELDINFGHPKRNRQTRKRSDLCSYANKLLEIAEALLVEVDRKIS